MIRTIRNKLVHDPDTAQAIGQASSARRQAFNLAVEYCLAHPNSPYSQVQKLLTRRRQEDPRRWAHSPVAVQRPGLKQGYNAVRAFHKADAPVLRECIREVQYRGKPDSKTRPPRQGNRPQRDPDHKRLFLKRGRKPEYLRVEQADAIRLVPDSNRETASTIRAGNLTLRLTRPIPANTDVRAITVIEARPKRLRKKDRKLGKAPRTNRNPEDKRYEVRIHQYLPDPEPIHTLETLGLDPGVVNLITDSDGDVHQMDQPSTARLEQLSRKKDARYQAIARLKRINPGPTESRHTRKLRKEIRALDRKIEGLRNNQECRIARNIANKVGGRHPKNVACEKTQVRNMTRSARGTMENPGRNVAQKAGLNRSVQGCRWSKLKIRIGNACQRQGTAYFEVRAANSSIRCSQCGDTSRENRKSQAEFKCTRCGHQDNADRNAAVNHARAAVPLLYKHLTGWMSRKKLPNRRTGGRESPLRWRPQDDRVSGERARRGKTCRRRNPDDPQGITKFEFCPAWVKRHDIPNMKAAELLEELRDQDPGRYVVLREAHSGLVHTPHDLIQETAGIDSYQDVRCGPHNLAYGGEERQESPLRATDIPHQGPTGQHPGPLERGNRQEALRPGQLLDVPGP